MKASSGYRTKRIRLTNTLLLVNLMIFIPSTLLLIFLENYSTYIPLLFLKKTLFNY